MKRVGAVCFREKPGRGGGEFIVQIKFYSLSCISGLQANETKSLTLSFRSLVLIICLSIFLLVDARPHLFPYFPFRFASPASGRSSAELFVSGSGFELRYCRFGSHTGRPRSVSKALGFNRCRGVAALINPSTHPAAARPVPFNCASKPSQITPRGSV